MFDFDAGKLIVIGIVALIAIPSKDLPRVLRQLGQLAGRTRRMAAEFQAQFAEALRESELDELKKEVDQVKQSVKLPGAFDPLAEARKQIDGAMEMVPLEKAPAAASQHDAPSPAERPPTKKPSGDASA